MKKQRGPHPGKVLFEQFMKPSALSQNALAREMGVPPRRINEIILGKRGISADTAIRLARHFGNSERFWMQLQADFDLEEARKAITS
jgi:addiction module HigA family antidote